MCELCDENLWPRNVVVRSILSDQYPFQGECQNIVPTKHRTCDGLDLTILCSDSPPGEKPRGITCLASKNRAEQTQQVVFHEQTKNLFAIPMLLLKYPLIEEQLEIIKIPKSSENLRVRMWHFSKLCSDAACGEKATEMLSIPLAEMDRF